MNAPHLEYTGEIAFTRNESSSSEIALSFASLELVAINIDARKIVHLPDDALYFSGETLKMFTDELLFRR